MNVLHNEKSGKNIIFDETTLGESTEERIENLTTLVMAKAEEAYMIRNFLE
jgi:hypothetical protein